jgi:hypothetical protein
VVNGWNVPFNSLCFLPDPWISAVVSDVKVTPVSMLVGLWNSLPPSVVLRRIGAVARKHTRR